MFDVRVDAKQFGQFLLRYLTQVVVVGAPLFAIYLLISWGITWYAPEAVRYLLLDTVLFWGWVGALGSVFALLLLRTRRLFGVELYFLA